MKMWCDKHGSYHDIQEWACPKCIEQDYISDDFRVKLIEQLLSRLPNIKNEKLWQSKAYIEEIIRQSLERVSQNQSLYNCMFYYDHERKVLDVSLIRNIERIRLEIDT